MDTLLSFIEPVVQYGLPTGLLLIFVKYFLEKDKQREQQFQRQIDEFNAQVRTREELLISESDKREQQYRDREKILVAESARREELLKKESDKREKIIREESEKRETALLATIDGFSRTLKEISDSLTEIKSATTQSQYKIDSIEMFLNQISNGQKGD